MSTRCNVIIKDSHDQIMFYRHSDGYPDGVASTLIDFLDLVKNDKLRDNAEQSAGWLIILGYEEYNRGDYGNNIQNMRDNTKGTNLDGWKVGSYEPCTGLHGDIEYLYEIDLKAKTLRGWEHDGETKGKEVTKQIKVSKPKKVA